MMTSKMDTFVLLREAHAHRNHVFWSPSKRVYCAFVGGNWSFTREDPIIAGAHKNCPAPFTDDWESLVRKEPQRGDVHPSCESCEHLTRYASCGCTMCGKPLGNTDAVLIESPALSYCSNHTAMRSYTAKVVDEPGELHFSNGSTIPVRPANPSSSPKQVG